jgi:HEAT repeat protein
MSVADITNLIEDLNCPDRATRRRAKEALVKIGPAAVEPLIAALSSQTTYQCYEAADVLSQIPDPRWLEPMAAALTSRHIILGQMAVRALENYPAFAFNVFIKALPDCHPMVQAILVQELEKFADRRAVRPLMQLLESPQSASVWYIAIQALGVLGDRRCIDLIRTFSDHEDPHIRNRTQEALKRLESA